MLSRWCLISALCLTVPTALSLHASKRAPAFADFLPSLQGLGTNKEEEIPPSRPYLTVTAPPSLRFAAAPARVDRTNLFQIGVRPSTEEETQKPPETTQPDPQESNLKQTPVSQSPAEPQEPAQQPISITAPPNYAYPQEVIRFFEERTVDPRARQTQDAVRVRLPFEIGQPPTTVRGEATYRRED